MQDQLDPEAVNLAKAIRQTESGGNFQAKGKSGEYGAYQFTQPTWDSYSKKHGVNTTLDKATPEQQNEVAYKQIKEWKDSGLNVGQIASMWNSGKPDAYKDTNYKGVNKMGVTYDVPAYAKSVATAYQTIKNGGQVGADPQNPSSVPQFPFTSQKDAQQTNGDTSDSLKAGDPKLDGQTNNGVTSGIIGAIGGGKLAQGLGYALSNASGTQDKFIDSQNQSMEVQKGLIQRIKENKAAGRDTTRLQKALNDINTEIEKGGEDASNVGTGGITNKEVLGSAAHLATNAILSYAGGKLPSYFKGSKALANPEVTTILEGAIGKGETIANLSRNEAINTLSNYLKEMSVSQAGGKTEQLVLKALQELNPSLVEKQGLLAKGIDLSKGLLKQGVSTGVGYVLGSTGKGIFDHITK